jgi:hypothetical protein
MAQVRIKPKHLGSLTSLGYFLSRPDGARQESLRQAVRIYGKDRVEDKLRLLITYRRNAIPGTDNYTQKHKVIEDLDYVTNLEGYSQKRKRHHTSTAKKVHFTTADGKSVSFKPRR